MRCLSEGRLRASLEADLPPEALHASRAHLSACARCRARLVRLRETQAVVEANMAAIAPPPASPKGRVPGGLPHRLQERSQVRMKRKLGKGWPPVLAGVMVVGLMIATYAVAPTQTFARQLLGVFRVRKFAVIRVSPDQAALDQVAEDLVEKLFVQEPEAVVDEPLVTVGSIEQARELAGFDARMPSYLPGGGAVEIEVKGRTEYEITFTREGIVAMLQVAEMDTDLVPDGWDEATARIVMPVGVSVANDTIQVVQVLNPSVEYPEGLSPSMVGEAGLRILGVAPAEAARIASTIDWTSTLVLPIPTDIGEFTELAISGADAVLVRPREYDGTNAASIVFEKDGVVYVVSGQVASEQLVQVAESMF